MRTNNQRKGFAEMQSLLLCSQTNGMPLRAVRDDYGETYPLKRKRLRERSPSLYSIQIILLPYPDNTPPAPTKAERNALLLL